MKARFNCLLLISFLFSYHIKAADYFWVNNAGDWTDLNHWATSSGGGVLHTQLPSINDNVFFDNNSFSSNNQIVSFNTRVAINNFSALNLDDSVTFTSAIRDLEIFGSLQVNGFGFFDIDNLFVDMGSDQPDNVVFIENGFLTRDKRWTLSFAGGGSWEINSNLELDEINLFEGDLSLNSGVTCSRFEVRGTGDKNLDITSTSIITESWFIGAELNNFSAANSSISVSEDFRGRDLIYNDLIIRRPNSVFGETEIEGNNTFNTLSFEAGAQVFLESGTQQTVNTGILFNGEIDDRAFLQRESNGQQVTSIAGNGINISGNFPVVENVSYVGSGIFNLDNGVLLGESNGWELTSLARPTDRGNFFFSKVYQDSVIIALEPGDGNERIVFMREANAFPDVNITQNTFYVADQEFSQGTSVGDGTFVVYQGDDDIFTVTGLNSESLYGISVVEANVNNERTLIQYNELSTSFSKSVNTLGSNDVIMTNGSLLVNDGNVFYDNGGSGDYFPNGNEIFTMSSPNTLNVIALTFNQLEINFSESLSIYEGTDTTGTLLATYDNNTVLPATVNSSTNAITIHFESSDFSISDFNSNGWLADIQVSIPTPTVIPSNLQVTEEAETQIDFNFDAGNGNGRLIIAKEGTSSISHTPIRDSVYLANASLGLGTNLGNGEFVVGFGDISSLALSSLSANSTYSLALFEFNRIGDEVVFSEQALRLTISNTLDAPTITASNLVFENLLPNSFNLSFDKGDGDGRLIIVTLGNTSSTFTPNNNTTYTGNADFNLAEQLPFRPLSRVVAFGDIDQLAVTDLPSTSEYTIEVIEYNELGANLVYAQPRTIERVDLSVSRPTINVSSLQISDTSESGITLMFSKGNGTGRLLIAKEGNGSFIFRPMPDSSYMANGEFGVGEDLGNGEFVIGYGDIDSLVLTNLNLGSNYRIVAYEFNQAGDDISYINFGVSFDFVFEEFTPVEDLTLPYDVSLNHSGVRSDRLLFDTFLRSLPYENSQILLLASENPILLPTLESALTNDLLIRSNSVFGLGDEIAEGVFAINKSNRGSNTSGLELLNLKDETTYYFAAVLFVQNGNRVGYGLNGIQFRIVTTREQDAIFMGEDDVTISNSRLHYSENGFSPSFFRARTETYFPETAGNKLSFSMIAYNFNSGSFLRIYDGNEAIEDNLLVEFMDAGLSGEEGFPVVNSTNENGSLTFEIGRLTSRSGEDNVGFRGITFERPTSFAIEPQPASAVTVSEINQSSANINWTRGSGESALVLINSGNGQFPLIDGVDIREDSVLIENNVLAAFGEVNSLTIDSLVAGRNYTIRIFEANGSGSEINYSSPLVTNFQTIDNRPTTAATNLSFEPISELEVLFNWDNGNGSARMVISSESRDVSGILSELDGREFLAESNFGSSQVYQINGIFFKVLYNGIEDSLLVTNVNNQNSENLFVLEYNGDGSNRNYLSSERLEFESFPPVVTIDPPTNLQVSDLTATSATLNWDDTNLFRNVLVYVSLTDEPIPVDRGRLRFNSVIGDFDKGFVAYFGRDTFTELTTLIPDTTYFVKLYSANVNGGLTFSVDRNNFTAGSFTTTELANYYWVGGSGNWEDLSHWATTSGGNVNHVEVPDSESLVILDDQVNLNDTLTTIYVRQSRDYFAHTLKANNLTKRVNISTDSTGSIDRVFSSLIISSSLIGSDSLQLNFSGFTFRDPSFGSMVDFKNKKTLTRRLGLRFESSFNESPNVIEVKSIPDELNFIQIDNASVDFSFVNDTIQVDRININSGLVPFLPPLRSISAINNGGFNFRNSFIATPYIRTRTGSFQANSTLAIDRFELLANELIINNNDTLRVDNFEQLNDGLLSIRTRNRSFNSYIESSQDSLIIRNATIIDNHAIGNSVYIARNSSFLENVSGWQLDGESDPLRPENSPIPLISFGDSIQVNLEFRLSDFTFGNVLAVLEKGRSAGVTPEDDVRYENNLVFDEARQLDGFLIADLGTNQLNNAITGLEPETEYTISLYAYLEGNDRILYANEGNSYSFKTAAVEDDYIIRGESSNFVANGQVIYGPQGIGGGVINLSFLENTSFTVVPNDVNERVALRVYELTEYNGVVSIYNGSDNTAPLIQRFNLNSFLRDTTVDVSQVFVSNNPEGALRVEFDGINQGFVGRADTFAFQAFSVANSLSDEPLPATNLQANNITANELTLTWESPANANTLIIAGTTELASVPSDFIIYEANSNFGLGDEIGEYFVVYNGSDNQASVQGLEERTDYNFVAFTYSGDEISGVNYLETNSASVRVSTPLGLPEVRGTLIEPVLQEDPTDISFFIDNRLSESDGFVLLIRENNRVESVPENGVVYAASDRWDSAEAGRLSDGSQVMINLEKVVGNFLLNDFNESTTYFYSLYAFNQNEDTILYSTTSLDGSFLLQDASFAFVQNLNENITLCPDFSFDFQYQYTGNNFQGQKARPILSLFEDMRDSTVLEVIDSAGFDMTVQIPSDIELGGYFMAVVPESGNFQVFPQPISIASIENPIITRNGFTLSSSTDENVQWFRNGELIEGEFRQNLNLVSDGTYTLRRTFGRCEYESNEIIVLPNITIRNNASYCTGNEITINTQTFGELVDDFSFNLRIANVLDSLYDNVLPVINIDNESFSISIGDDIAEGEYYFQLIEVEQRVETNIFRGNIINLVTPEITQSGESLVSSYVFGNQWFLNGVLIEGEINQEFVPITSGEYTVEVNFRGCTVLSLPFDVIVTNVNTDITQEVKVFPNPVNDLLTIKLSQALMSNSSINLYQLNGKIVSKEFQQGRESNEFIIDLSQISAGLYILVIESENKKATYRIVKE